MASDSVIRISKQKNLGFLYFSSFGKEGCRTDGNIPSCLKTSFSVNAYKLHYILISSRRVNVFPGTLVEVRERFLLWHGKVKGMVLLASGGSRTGCCNTEEGP